MQLGSRPLFPFLFLSLIAACGSDGSGGSGGSGGSSTQTGGSGSGARGGSSAGGSGGSSSTGTGGSSSTGTGGSSSTGTGGSSAGTGGSGAGTGGGGAGGSGGSSAGGSGGSQSGTGGSGTAPDGGPAAEAGGGGMLKVDRIFEIPGATASAPHDPAVDGKGVSWWTDQNGSRVGFWDPATEATMSFPTPTPNCGVHGLTPDDKDNIWYTGQACNRIGRIDAATKMVTDFVVPGGGRPHTPVFLKGTIWFTLQGGNAIGRIDTAAPNAVQTYPIGPGPYGIWIAPNEKLWVALFGTNQIVEVDPANPGSPNRITLPNAGSRPRRIAVDKKGHVYYTDDPRGYLGRYDPNPGTPQGERFKEWAAPGGGAPYAITVGPDDRIYYGFGGRNVIAVFDPANPDRAQQVIPIAVQLTANRHMTTDHVRRRVWLGLSGARRMAYIQVP